MTRSMNKWVILLVISLGGGVIYIFPYLQYTFYDSMMESLGFTNTQMGNIMSVYGSLNLIAYFVGGIFADRFSTKKLITFSLIGSGLSGLWFANFPSYTSMLVISVIWSITTIFTYWPAMIKAVKLLGDSDVQGRLFGFREALNSLFALVFSSLALVVFSRTGDNFKNVVLFYSFVYILVGIITYILLPDTEVEEIQDKPNIFSGLSYVLKSRNIWLIGLIIFFGYAIGATMGRLAPYLTAVYKMGVTTAAMVGILNTYAVGNVGAVAGGLITDKLKSSTKFLMYSFVVMAVLLTAFILLPGNPSFLLVAVVMGLSIRLVQTAVRGVYFVPLDEAKIPDQYLGVAAGVVSVIGFMPDAFLFSVYGSIMDKFPGEIGYKIMFGSLIAFSVIGFILTIILFNSFGKNKIETEQ